VIAEHREFMRLAIREAERARGTTGDNPWVGCVIVDASGAVVAGGHTQGPGEDHAEIVAIREAAARGVALDEATLYSTLEPCAFHGRTPACARAIVTAGVRRVVTGILDPNPRVDGEGLRILRGLEVEVIEDVCSEEITRQLAPWIFRYHPHEPLRRCRALHAGDLERTVELARELYDLDVIAARDLVTRALEPRTE
jgi:diaminohydroxyphosphoribosylaminopyrimidine deaminase/5-amino-6-(5-phosphoribosylamino)uracil reductase